MNISFKKNRDKSVKNLALPITTNKLTTQPLKDLDTSSSGALTAALKASPKFKGSAGDIIDILCPYNTDLDRLCLLGFDLDADEKNSYPTDKKTLPQKLIEIGAKLAKYAKAHNLEKLTLDVSNQKSGKLGDGDVAAHVSYGFVLRSWSFDKYKTPKKDDSKTSCQLDVVCTDTSSAQKLYEQMEAVASGVFLTRELISEPPNVIHPESMAEIAKSLKKVGLKVDVLGEKDMRKLGMNALLGVGQGSDFESQMVIVEWRGDKSSKQGPVALVGKGVTFDSGGLSLKPAGSMEDMKTDMSGAATVLGVMKSLALRKAKVNVVGLLGLVENMPSGTAQRPGDVVKSMSGQTIEILNTDAEGRLVLADVLWYCQDRFKPQAMVNLATLTGAIIVALGHQHAGLFSNDDKLADQLFKAGQKTSESLWRLPLCSAHNKDINSDIADMKNIGSGRGAGSITAAHFLQRFVNNTPWAHLDIAGTAYDTKETSVSNKGATGFGVRLLQQWIFDNYESQ